MANPFPIGKRRGQGDSPVTTMTDRNRILIAGPTPAIQRRLEFDRVEPGAVNRAARATVFASGKGVNCARAARGLGGDPSLVLFAGGAPGDWLCRELEAGGFRIRRVNCSSPTRTCTTLVEHASGQTTELVENAGPAGPGESAAFAAAFGEELVRAGAVICIGTLPPGVDADLYGQLVARARAAGLPAVVDAQGACLLACLEARPTLVKPNRHELAAATGIACDEPGGVWLAAGELGRRGAEAVLVTDGPDAARLWTADSRREFAPPAGDAPNPIGSGDTVAAGIGVALLEGRPLPKAVAFGIACGTANARGEGYGNLDAAMAREMETAVWGESRPR